MKISSLFHLALAAAFFSFSPSAVWAQEENCGESLNLEDADIRSVVDEMALRTGRKFVLDPRVQGRITIKSGPDAKLCPDEAWELFQASLRVLGFTATPINGNSYRVVPAQEGPRAAGPVGEGRAGDIVTQIVRLRHVDAREAAANLSQIISERGVVAPVRTGNAIILVDTSDNVERLRGVLRQLDRDTTVYRTIQLNHASAAEVAGVVGNLAQEISEEGGEKSRISVVPVDGSNSILIRAEPGMINRLAGVVAELDQIGESKSDLSVIYLKHADAEELTSLLREIASTQSGEGESVVTRSRAAISFHKPTNAVIISGDANIQATLQNVVRQLDVRRSQVLVEAIIVEVSDKAARELGLQYFLSGDGSSDNRVPFSATNFSRAQPNILAAAGAAILEGRSDSLGDLAGTLADTALTSALGVNGFALGGAGRTSNGTFFGAILTAIQKDTGSNVLSTPSVVTLDNQLATLSVGQEIPITTGEAVGDNFSNAFRTVSRQEVGTILEVTPQINEGGTVALEITQETSSVAGQIISSSTDLITNKRVISTTALVDDGDILVIGGLISESQEDSEDKIPLLGAIPVAGNLFKASGRSLERRNLMVFIKPTILRDRASAASATRKKLDYIEARERLYNGAPESNIERLIDQVTGAETKPYVPTPAQPLPADETADTE